MAAHQSRTPPETEPHLSVVMAVYNNAGSLAQAAGRVLDQSLGALELLISDDGSTDGSLHIAEGLAASDPRVRVLTGPNGGPGAARNRALDAARGAWVGIVDADDLVHPLRFERMIAAATAHKADILADDQLLFDETGGLEPLAAPILGDGPRQISPAFFIRCNTEGAGLPALGYLKPVIRRATIGARRYQPEIRIGEDYHFLLTLLRSGAQMWLLPEAWYLYRRHAGSISHRLSVAHVEAMVAAHAADTPSPDEAAAHAARGQALGRALAYERLVAAIKARKAGALGAILRKPWLLRPLARSLAERLARRQSPAPSRPATLRLAQGAPLGPGTIPPADTASPALWAALTQGLALERTTLSVEDAAGLNALFYLGTWARAELAALPQTARPLIPRSGVRLTTRLPATGPALAAAPETWAKLGLTDEVQDD